MVELIQVIQPMGQTKHALVVGSKNYPDLQQVPDYSNKLPGHFVH
jgi:hypothetical protein